MMVSSWILPMAFMIFYQSLETSCFVTPNPSFRFRSKGAAIMTSSYSRLYSSNDDNDGNSNSNSNSNNEQLDMLRNMLEASWNVEAMGAVPSTPENAAEEAAAAVGSAKENNQNLLMIDILLPSYDITQGENLYDEVLAVEFCISLALSLHQNKKSKQSAIFVKNGRMERSVSKILNIKEERRIEELELLDDDDDDDDYGDDEDDIEQDFDATGSVVEYNDFDDFGSMSSSLSNTDSKNDASGGSTSTSTSSSDGGSSSDIDSFRQQLMSSWNDDSNDQSPQPSSKPSKNKSNESKSKPASSSSTKPYRIGSLFGDQPISQGPDMFDNVLAALDKYADVKDEDDTLILLSSFSQEETIAIRRFVAKYKTTNKTLVFVNCKLDPMPRELIRATTVYSILPLIAKPVVSETNIFANPYQKAQAQQQLPTPPKIALLRRYPRDWELFIDADGNGFQLIDSISASSVPPKGPSVEWIGSCVKRYMRENFDGR